MGWTGARAERPGRHLLQGRGFCATTGDADRFGQTFYALAEEATGLSRAGEVLFACDGAGWLADLPSDWISPTAYQLDHSCGKLRIKEVARDPERAARWWGWVAEHNLEALGRSIRSGIASGGTRARGRGEPPRPPDPGHGPGGLAGLVGGCRLVS